MPCRPGECCSRTLVEGSLIRHLRSSTDASATCGSERTSLRHNAPRRPVTNGFALTRFGAHRRSYFYGSAMSALIVKSPRQASETKKA
jgi:hypothetical protein